MLGIEEIFLWMMVLTRVVGLFLVAPIFSHSGLPVIARMALAVSLSIAIFPMVEFDAAYPSSVLELALWTGKEMMVGLAMGLAVRMLFFMLDFAATVLTLQVGIMPSPEFDPTNASSFNPLGSILYFFGIVLLLNGSEYDILRAFVGSFQIAPIGFVELNEYAIEYIILTSMGIFKTGILIAAPVIAVSFLVNLAFAVLGKVVPKLNVFILSLSVRILAGASILAFSTLLIVHYVVAYTDRVPEMMLRFIFFRPVF